MRTIILAAIVLTAGAPSSLAQDVEAGERAFAPCRSCHQVGEGAKNSVGPVLNGLFGRKSGSVEGYGYSEANRKSGITWDEATFREYIVDPRGRIPGTRMTFAGIRNPRQVTDLIAFLKQFDAAGKKAP